MDASQKSSKEEASEQSSRLRVACGAAGLGAVAGLCLPVVGGFMLAAAGAAAGVGLTTKDGDVGDAARAGGRAAADGAESLVTRVKNLDRERLANAAKKAWGGADEAPKAPERPLLAWWPGAADARRKERVERLGGAKTPAAAAEAVVREIAPADPDQRRREALSLLRDLHPDKQPDATVARRAVAESLTRIVVAVRDHLDATSGWAFEDVDAAAKECAAVAKRALS